MKQPKVSFQGFLRVFPEVELPVTLNEESVSLFSRMNDPLPAPMIAEFIVAHDSDYEDDGMTEYIPCLSIPETHDFHAIVYWKGGLLKSQFVLSTFGKDGQLLSSATIGGLESDGKSVVRSIATIDEDWRIHIVEGQQDASEERYDPEATRGFQMELLATGEIIFLLGDDD